ncbi:MAG: chromosomal replication initiator protein DnaA [Holosporaceae bacterium]|jgi:chromosomal replication initiator protein|nr:chromosomal replication initiator protein DnaA [Holosporaceae bacterium]
MYNFLISEHLVSDVDLEVFWNSVHRKLRSEFGDPVVDSWISPLSIAKLEGDTLHLVAPSMFFRDWVQNNYHRRIVDVCNQESSAIKCVDISVFSKEMATGSTQTKSKVTSERTKTDDAASLSIPLDSKLTFENFVVGKPNELAYAAALRVAESDSVAFNPLFLYGAVGLGKTHLMHAIAWNIKSRSPNRNIAYMSAEKFMYHFVRSVRYKDTMAFKDQFRAVDVLMIDDIQFICGKESTQEEFFHTFNALVDNNRQVIVSADKSPSDLDGMEERLKSRLGWGLVADIHPTTYELRLGILHAKAAACSVKIPDKVLEFVAHKVTSNVRELEGALNRIIASAVFIGREITVENAREVLSDLLRTSERKVTVEEIQKKVAVHYAIKLSDMFSPRRVRQLALPRQIAMYLAKKLTTLSLPEIGKSFGGKNHTTVLHAVKKINELIDKDHSVSEDIKLLTHILTA